MVAITSLNSTNASTSENINNNNNISNLLINLKLNNPIQIKSQFKTIKVFVVSNKDEFNHEIEYLIKEAQTELQQYFLEYGYDLFFIDVNLNYDLDPFMDPYLFQAMLNEVEECSKSSDACFFLILLGNKNGLVPLPLEISQLDYELLKTTVQPKDFEFFKTWYYQDENSLVPCYRLKPLIKTFSNMYNRQPDNIDSFNNDSKSLKETHTRLLEIIQSINGNNTIAQPAAASTSQTPSTPTTNLTQPALNTASTANASAGQTTTPAEKQTPQPPSPSLKPKQEKFTTSGIEQLINAAFKQTLNECFMIYRNIDGIDSNKKKAERYLDITNGKLDKFKEEKHQKLKDLLMNKFDDHHKFKFNLKWKEQYEDICNIISAENQVAKGDSNDDIAVSGRDLIASNINFNPSATNLMTDNNNNNNNNNDKNENTANKNVNIIENGALNYNDNINNNNNNNNKNTQNEDSLSKYDEEFKSYLKQFNAVIVSYMKNTVEKKLKEELELTKRSNEIILYHEVVRHMFKLNELFEISSIDSNDYIERCKKLITIGSKSTHFPIFLYGSQLSGKTTCLAKFGMIAARVLSEQKNVCFVVRFSDLTSQSSSFEGTLLSMCEQLCLIQKLNPLNELKNKDLVNLIDYFYKIIGLISKSKTQVVILIDDIQDFCIDKPPSSPTPPKPQTLNNQISWLFQQELPVGIHLIATIRHQTPNTNIAHNNQLLSQNSIINLQQHVSVASTQSVSLFLHFYNEKMSNEAENYLFELPLQIKKSSESALDLNTYIKSEFQKNGRNITDEQLQIMLKYFNSSKSNSTDNNEHSDQHKNGTTNNTSANNSSEAQINNFPYLNFVIKEITSNRSNLDLRKVFVEDRYPKNLESFILFRISNLEKKFNPKLLSVVFNYITASHNGITELELLDLLSCNNDFFTDYYSNKELPSMLRFPLAVWLLIKYQLSDLLTKKYLDNKIVYCWRHECIKKIMKQRYFNKVDQIRNCHKDIANYFLESFIDKKPLIDMSHNMQIRDEHARRYICQQPLLYSDTKYNYRRLSELWYHLMNSGDVPRLKEHAFFNFEHLLAKCHGTSLKNLLNDIDAVQKRILDADILLIFSFFKKSFSAISQDPLRLSSEILARLRPLQDDYGEYVKNLIVQANDWSEQFDSPVLVPLSNWVESPENLLITRIDHLDGILKIAVTSFNQHVFFSTTKNEICMYHIPSKKLVKKFVGHQGDITFLLLSYNNKYLISGSSDKLVKVWNLGTGEADNTYNMHKSSILCGVITHTDEYLVTGSYNKVLNVIRIETGDVIHSIENHSDAITALCISQDDTILLSASADKSIKRWALDDMQLIDTISTIYSPITSMTMSPDNIFIIIGCENSCIQVKSLVTGSDVHDLAGHYSNVTNLAVSADSEKVYVGCTDSKLYLFDVKSRELIAILIEQESTINDLKISIDGTFLFSSSGNSLYVMNLKKKDFMASRKSIQPTVSKIIKASAMSKEGDLAITADESGQVNLWNLLNAELIVTIIDPVSNLERKGISKLALSNSRLFSLIAFMDGMISVYDNEMGDIVAIFVEHQQPVKHLYVFEDNRRVLSSDGNNSCKIWYSHSGELLESITVACELFGLSPDMKYCVSGPGKNTLKLWGLNNSQVIRNLDHPERITVYTFTFDSQFVITGGDDNSCKIWELATGKLVQVLIEHDAPITSISVSSNNSLIVSGSKDKLAIIWDFKDGSVIHKLLIHQDIIVKVAVSDDGNVVITASRDSTINVWSSRTGNLITSTNLQYTLTNLLVSSDCNRMMATFKDNKSLCIIGLTNKWSKENIRSLSQASLKSAAEKNLDLFYNAILPIKPKALKFQKISKSYSKYLKEGLNTSSSTTAVADLTKNGPNQEIVQAKNENSTSNQTKNSKGGIFQRVKKKKQKGEFSSTISMSNNEEKPKKTKICCLL